MSSIAQTEDFICSSIALNLGWSRAGKRAHNPTWLTPRPNRVIPMNPIESEGVYHSICWSIAQERQSVVHSGTVTGRPQHVLDSSPHKAVQCNMEHCRSYPQRLRITSMSEGLCVGSSTADPRVLVAGHPRQQDLDCRC